MYTNACCHSPGERHNRGQAVTQGVEIKYCWKWQLFLREGGGGSDGRVYVSEVRVFDTEVANANRTCAERLGG